MASSASADIPAPALSAPAILQVLPALVAGGVERGTVEIAEAQVAAGYRAVVASAGGPMVEALRQVGAEHVTLPLAEKLPWALWRNAGLVARLVRERDIRLLHARSRGPAWSSLLAARRTGARFVTTYHGTYNEGLPGKRLYNSVMARGERVIAISVFIRDLILARHRIDAARLRLIHRGVDTRRFDPDQLPHAAAETLRAAWQIPPAGRVILLPARISRWKGQDVLIRALPHMPEDVVAVLAGDAGRGGYARSLAALAAEQGVAGRLRLVGHLEPLAPALAAADVVVHASTEPEAFGRSVIEAQAMRRPVIASRLGGPMETVVDGRTGWLAPPGDPAALASLIRAVLEMPPEQRAAVGAAARADVLRRFSVQAMQAATLDVYRELL